MAVVQTALDALVVLAERYSFAEVAALLAAGAGGERLSKQEVVRLQQLCAFGQRLLDLDAEDFGEASDAELAKRSLECRMPQSPHEDHRGALGSLRPVYRLLLEVVRARFARGEMANVVATVHIASEYAPLLVWERVLGHAGDPARLAHDVAGEGSLWGELEERECPHTKTEKSAAKRVLTVARENSAGWQSYLDRQHSNVSRAIAICAAECRRQCTVYTRLSPQDRATVTAGSRIAMALNDSAVVRLRHSAPVGHAFGVPSQAELLEAWGRTRESLTRFAPSLREDDGFPLPGFTALITELAGTPMAPDTLLADTAAAITDVLGVPPARA